MAGKQTSAIPMNNKKVVDVFFFDSEVSLIFCVLSLFCFGGPGNKLYRRIGFQNFGMV